jgi:hypothetical protein
MATIVVELLDSEVDALKAEAEQSGITAGDLLARLARARADHHRRVGSDVVAIIDRQIAEHRSAFDRLAE